MDKNITSNKKTFKLKIIIYICWLVGIERLENSKEMMIKRCLDQYLSGYCIHFFVSLLVYYSMYLTRDYNEVIFW